MTTRRLAAALAIPLVIALPPLFWIVEATHRLSLASIGRDQGIFQYIAWAIDHGAKSYRDIRDVNGPLIHFVHLVLFKLGGGDEHRFHVLDLAITGATFAFAGACLPGIARVRSPQIRAGSSLVVPIAERAAWALAAWVVLSAQYLLYLFWDVAQRESFCDWFLLTSVALQLVAQSPARSGRRDAVLFALVGALSVIPWFGKPTYVLFTIAQIATLIVDRGDRDAPFSRVRRVASFATGGVVGAFTQLAFVLRYGDIGAFFRVSLVDVPAFYRFIWPRSASEILTDPGSIAISSIGLASSAVLLALIVRGDVPRRALAVALMPACGLASVLVQHKGFIYHFHPITLGTYFIWLLVVAWLAEVTRGSITRARGTSRLFPLALAGALAFRIVSSIQASPHLQNVWILAGGATAKLREGGDYLSYFRTPDFSPYEMRLAAAYLREHTKPDDRVQTYGMDPYVLFLAERLSATPYIYAYDLDAAAAIEGGWSLVPNDAEKARIIAMRDEHERDLLARLKAAPPAAFVFFDKSPVLEWRENAWLDFTTHCPTAATWVEAHYRPTAEFNDIHVWMRSDVDDAIGER